MSTSPILMGGEEVKLVGDRIKSPFSCRVEIALKLKGIEYEFVQEDLSRKSDHLLKYNLIYKMIPVLVHNGKPISESTLIVEYIDEAFIGPSILPHDPYHKANARFWAKFIDDKISVAMKKCFFGKSEEHEEAKNEIPQLLKILETQLEGNKKFFGGDKIGFVDIVAVYVGYWLGIFEEAMGIELVTKDKFAKLSEWMDNLVASNLVKECLPPRDHLLEALRAHFGKA